MLEFAQWVAEDKWHFVGTLVFIGACCWFVSWPLAAIRGGRLPDDNDL